VEQRPDLRPPIPDLADRLAGQASDDAIARIAQWSGEDPDRLALVHALEHIEKTLGADAPAGTSAAASPRDAVTGRIIGAVRRRIDTAGSSGSAATGDGIAPRLPRPHSVWVPQWATRFRSPTITSSHVATLAAGVVTAAAVGLAMLWPSAGPRTPDRIYATASAQRARITLRDGSHVILAPHSTLRVAQGFGVTNRELSLTGEAYFDVAHTSAPPFLVQAGSAHVRVLGTEFYVRRYTDDTVSRVTVMSGRVAFGTSGARGGDLVVAAGQVGVADDSTQTVAAVDNTVSYTEWRSGQLVFHRVVIPDMLKTLEHWYGYRFRLTDSTLSHQHITTVLDDDSPTSALKTLELVLHVDVTVDGDVVTLSPQRQSDARRERWHTIGDTPSTTTEVGR
jgi:ferric-dicitrate binding protein FerR (iron transport regulator)